MGLFGKKLTKEEKAQKAADEKANAEFEAAYTAKMERKKVEKHRVFTCKKMRFMVK